MAKVPRAITWLAVWLSVLLVVHGVNITDGQVALVESVFV